jgi:hypothetical protein
MAPRTNASGVTENAEFNIDPKSFGDNYTHIFRKDICACEECLKQREEKDKE